MARPAAKPAAKSATLAAALDGINKDFGDGAIMRMGENTAIPVHAISTGIKQLDLALGVGGLPLGRMVEIFGPESCMAWDTFIQYEITGTNGKRKNHKGGTIENLYYRFHGQRRPGRRGRPPVVDSTDTFSAPCMNDEGRIFQNRIVDVVDTGRKPVIQVQTATGITLRATAEHKFFTGSGYKMLGDLSPGDQVWIHNQTPFMVLPEDRSVSPRPTVMVKHHPNGHDKFVGPYKYRKLQRSHIAYEAVLNGLDYEVYVQRLNAGDLDGLSFLEPGLHIHHIDEDWTNDDPANLLPITPRAHGLHHSLENHNNLRYMVVPDEIVALTPCGDQHTYDIRMESPHNNYIANGVVVHNSGKSTLAMHVIAEAQRQGLTCAYIDAEYAMDPVYARALHVNVDDLLIAQPNYGEQGLEIIDRLASTGEVSVIVVDSVATLTPRAEIEGEYGDAHVGLHARMMSQALRKLTGVCANNNVMVLWINQIREKVGVIYGSPEVTPGGRALKFYSSVRLDVRRKETIKTDGDATANRTRVKVVKNKVAPPYKECEFDIEFGTGVDQLGGLIDVAVDLGVLNKSGGWYATTDGEKLGNGKANAKQALRDDPDLLAAITEGVEKAWKS